jgi:SAM-dependent methyltransferase
MKTPASISALPLYPVTKAETFFRAFHTARPAVTSRALARAGSYTRLAALVPRTGRILDLACGDSYLASLTGAIGVDLAPARLAGTRGVPLVAARAQQLPFADGAFAAATCHLAFMLFDDIEQVVAELGRVLQPGAPFLALLGGGPTGAGADAFHAFAEHVPRGVAFGDPRARSEAGWRELFADGWRDVTFERWELDLSGTLDEVWAFLGASYQLVVGDRVRAELARRFPGDRVPCSMATYVARVIRR